MKKVCMVVQNTMVKGGIAAVVNGYRGSQLEQKFDIIYVESYKDGNKFAKFIKGMLGYVHFAKVLLINRPDLVHIHSSFGPSFYRKIPFIYMASRAKIKIINHIHGADFEEFYLNATNKKREKIRKIYDKCSVLIALSSEWKDKLSNIVDKNKIVIIENYSTLNENAVEQRNNRMSNNIVLFLGEIGKRKGCFDIPKVVKQVADEVPNVKFILAGAGNSTDEYAIKQLIEQEDVLSHVVLPGWVRGVDKDRLLREADVFFLPSYNEGMPMSVLDAMGYGLPIVSTNVGGIPKIVHDQKNGFCCNVGDINAFSVGITRLLNENELRIKSGNMSYDIVKKNYSLDSHLNLLEELYKSM